MAIETIPSICRNCPAFCPVVVSVEDGRAVKVAGDPEASVYEGYCCPKARIIPDQLYDPNRLLHALKRGQDGSHHRIPADDAIAEIARKLEEVIERHGPRSVALYMGTGTVPHPFGALIAAAMFNAIGSPMMFNAGTIDKPAEKVAPALHGFWMGGGQSFAESDTWMIVGGNPLISKSSGVPNNNPGRRLKDAVDGGMKLIVIDPRRTETAKRALIHLQPLPGEDPAILAGIIHIIISEKLYDQAFVAENAQGLEALNAAVSVYTPEYVAQRAGINADDLITAARIFATSQRGGVQCATGPSFSMHSNLSFYLGLCINTLCGRWAREGERVVTPNVVLPAFQAKAQALPPYPVYGNIELSGSGMRENASGLPTAGLADEILKEGDGRIRALFCLGGNPVSAWPDQHKAEAAMKALDLLVVLDCNMSGTARLADYVIPPPLPMETSGLTYLSESMKYQGMQRGYQVPWGQYVPAAVPPPPGSDVLEEHRFFFRLAHAMKLDLTWTNYFGTGKFVESPPQVVPLDMSREPSLDDLFELATTNSRITLSELKQYPHGKCFDIDARVAPRDPGNDVRLELADPMMMAELQEIFEETPDAKWLAHPFRLVSRRTNVYMNSVGMELPGLNRGKPYNPLHVNRNDADGLSIADGDMVEIRSIYGAIHGMVEIDDSLRDGVVSMSHGFGARDENSEHEPLRTGSNINLLTSVDEHDYITGIPRMSAIPVSISRIR